MNQTFTYWSFPKNRPTIQTNPPHEPAKSAAASDSKKNRRQSQTMPNTQRQYPPARATGNTPGAASKSKTGLLSGPAL
jgi:hypothetical protein